jgi:hypothetical protein
VIAEKSFREKSYQFFSADKLCPNPLINPYSKLDKLLENQYVTHFWISIIEGVTAIG